MALLALKRLLCHLLFWHLVRLLRTLPVILSDLTWNFDHLSNSGRHAFNQTTTCITAWLKRSDLSQQSLKAYGFWRALKWIPQLRGKQGGVVSYKLNNELICLRTYLPPSTEFGSAAFLKREKASVFHLWTVVFGTPTFRLTRCTNCSSSRRAENLPFKNAVTTSDAGTGGGEGAQPPCPCSRGRLGGLEILLLNGDSTSKCPLQ